jgi:hypothetical protein
VLQAYGWDHIPTSCGFSLNCLDCNDDITLPPDLQERIASGELFFDTVRDDVLARLLALNAERHRKEQARGLQGKLGMKGAGQPHQGNKRRGRPPKLAQNGETAPMQSIQLGLG